MNEEKENPIENSVTGSFATSTHASMTALGLLGALKRIA